MTTFHASEALAMVRREHDAIERRVAAENLGRALVRCRRARRARRTRR